MKVLVGCEESQAVCVEFRKLGHEAFSCDLQQSSGNHPEWHLKMSVFDAIKLKNWDLGIFFPPCTYLSNAGIGYFNVEKYGQKAVERFFKRIEAFKFAMKLYYCKIPKVCLENPVGWINTAFRKPDQVIEPYFFGDSHKKRTCLWLKNLPPLVHIKNDTLFEQSSYTAKPSPIYVGGDGRKIYFVDALSGKDQQKLRSKTFPGIAKAMAEQWGK